ncbi:MAG: transcriptional regulator [Sphaerochaetaceae bacterium]|nr:transcriptional regulator [Sphaerochaetaceae bacterium]MDC7237597.1 transcriptional regulator [Sphaerochaetaceae bacterium]MDC7243765.1 transcriptional regulator [Sphaerochaetaceae bacterium]
MDYPNLNKLIHEQSRLKILIYLSKKFPSKTTFTKVRKDLNMTSGNLSIQLKKLEESNLINQDKKIEKNKVKTYINITNTGIKSLNQYLNDLESLLSNIKGDNDELN